MSGYAHLASPENEDATVCGLPFEPWQQSMPSDEEIGLRDLPYDVRVLVRKDDEARRASQPNIIRQCPACMRLAATLATDQLTSTPKPSVSECSKPNERLESDA